MSYAAAAAAGPKQSPEEKRAPPLPEIEHTDSPSTSSLIDVDTPSVHTVDSDFSSHDIQTKTQAERLEREAVQAEAKAADVARAEKESHKKGKEPSKSNKAKKAPSHFDGHADNPVFVGNAIAVVVLSAGLGFGAYRKYAAGELTWKVVAAWTGVVGLFVAGDYYLSRYLFATKYPPKK